MRVPGWSLVGVQGLADPETFDVCVDTVSELIRSTRIAHPEADQLAPDQVLCNAARRA